VSGAALIMALGALRRLLRPVPLLLATGAGALAGLIVRGLPESELAARAYPLLAATLGALVALPLAAGWICAERQSGYEQLIASRRISSFGWSLGRLAGSLVGAGSLLLVLFAVARVIGGSVLVPEVVDGVRMDEGGAVSEWRFPVPAEHPGPYELQLDVLASRVGQHALEIGLRRGGVPLALGARSVSSRHVRLTLPDLAPARGDLFVTLRPAAGLKLDTTAPRLQVGRIPLGRAGLPPPVESATRLLVALLAGVAAACAFRFETACLAALLALVLDPAGHPLTLIVTLVFLVGFATSGTALARRTAIP
jgi:hypothetical protein